MKWLSVMVVLVGVNVAVAAKAKVSIRGDISDISANAFLVEGKKEADTEHDKARVTILKTTKVFRVEGDVLKEVNVEDLKKGMRVEIIFTGPVKESYPVQANAGKIIILPDAKKEK